MANGCNHILRGMQVARYLGCSLSSIYSQINAGLLPTPIRYGRQSVAWHSQELDVVINAQNCGYTTGELKELVQALISTRNPVKEDGK